MKRRKRRLVGNVAEAEVSTEVVGQHGRKGTSRHMPNRSRNLSLQKGGQAAMDNGKIVFLALSMLQVP